MKAIVTWLVVFVFGIGFAFGQDRPTITAQPNSVFVGADGKFEANPDTALVQFNISAQEDNSKAAYDRASKAAEQVRQILRSNGIEPTAAQLGYFSIEPIYDYTKAKRKLVAYRVNVNVSLKLKDFTKIAPIVQQLSDADVTDDQSITYQLDDIEAAKTKAVEDAYRRARARWERCLTRPWTRLKTSVRCPCSGWRRWLRWRKPRPRRPRDSARRRPR